MLHTSLKQLAIGSCLAGLCGGVCAAEAGADNAELAEIVVTAQKTSEVASKIPISISAVSAAQLSEEHITDYSDLSRAVPNVSFTNFGGAGQSNIEMRGVSSQAGSATTGIYLDDVPINILNLYTAGATEPRFFDIERVEILRGPQGTLYGAGSMGGTIHFVSVSPDLHNFSGSAHATVGGTEGGGLNYEADSIVNLPVSQGRAALRLGALYDRQDGWIDRVSPDGGIVARNINSQDTSVVRATLDLHPTDALTITPAAFLQRITTGGQDLFGLSLPQFQSPTLLAETNRDEYAIVSATVRYDFGWSDLTSISGYFWRNDQRLIDGTFYDSVFLGSALQQQFGYGGAAISALAAPSKFYTNVNQIHQEIRLASKPSGPDDPWTWIVGLYYSRTRTGLLDDEHIPGFNNTFESVYGDTPLNILGAAFPDDLIYHAFSEFVNSQTSGFGQATYRILPNLKLTAGVRYEKANEDLSFDSEGYFSGGTPPFTGSARGHAVTPKVALSYELTPSSMVYASAAEGYRDGGVNRPVPVPICSADLASLGMTQAPGSYKSDKLWSYELGAKTRALQDSLSISGALFDIRWTNIQTDIVLPTCTFDIKDNIGSAESRGVELELTQRLLDGLNWSLGGNYTSAKITSPVTLLGVQRGDRVPGVPDYSVSTSLEYKHPLTAIGARGLLRTNAQWVGSSQGVIQHGDPDFDRPSYFVMGASGGLQWSDYEVSLFVTNLLGNHKVIQRPNIALVEYGVTVRPRTFGISGSYSF
jgi:iron complex outermembrane receptor protein